jgi:hypothetical protein
MSNAEVERLHLHVAPEDLRAEALARARCLVVGVGRVEIAERLVLLGRGIVFPGNRVLSAGGAADQEDRKYHCSSPHRHSSTPIGA